MKEQIKKINIICFIVILFGFGIFHMTMKDKLIDKDERRYLTTFPKFTIDSIKDGTYYDDFEDYLLDQSPFRVKFRELKSFANYNIFRKQENENIIIDNNIIIKLDLDYNYDRVAETSQKLRLLRNKMFRNNNVYFALIPDKNCYLTSNGVDYETVLKNVKINNVNNISLYNQLDLNKYYKTDTHWNQIKIQNVANYILSEMGVEIQNIEYDIRNEGTFKGILSSQGALKNTDVLEYLYNDMINNCIVYDYETNKEITVYNIEKLSEEKCLDKYDLFLSGSVPLIRIDNPEIKDEKILVVLRDSFGSSMTPLFIPYYSSIYVVDLRYINTTMLQQMIQFNGSEDVLFMYSTTLMETPDNFKID